MSREQMKWRTCLSSITYFGHRIDVVKSGIQKYLRRGQLDLMIWCVSEIYLFQVFAETDREKQATKGIITNLINRLIIMLDEEMLFTEWAKYKVIRRLFEIFEESDRDNFLAVIEACKIMCSARILRRTCDIKRYFGRYMTSCSAAKPGSLVTRNSCASLDSYNFRNFVAYFQQKKMTDRVNCFYWLLRIYNGRRSGEGNLRGCRANIYVVWSFLLKTAFDNRYLREALGYRLADFRRVKRGEQVFFLIAATDLALHRDRIDWDPKQLNCRIETTRNDLCVLFEGRANIEFHDYVIDKHCALGRARGKTIADFVKTGAVVIGEDKEYFVQKWRDCLKKSSITPLPTSLSWTKIES